MTSTSKPGLTAGRRREALRFHADQLAGCLAAVGADVTVPTCPGWTVADLVAHVGQTQRWVAEIIEHRIVDPGRLPTAMAAMPVQPRDRPAWLSDGGALVAAACSDEALVAPVFNPAADARTGGEFWLSSMLNEMVIHGADAAYAAGTAFDLDADVAAHLISNHLTMLTSPTWAALRQESAAALRGAGETMHWHADDGGDWLVERTPDGARWEPRAGDADVSVTGPASTLLLVLTRRRPPTDGLNVDGRRDLFEYWIEHTAHVAG